MGCFLTWERSSPNSLEAAAALGQASSPPGTIAGASQLMGCVWFLPDPFSFPHPCRRSFILLRFLNDPPLPPGPWDNIPVLGLTLHAREQTQASSLDLGPHVHLPGPHFMPPESSMLSLECSLPSFKARFRTPALGSQCLILDPSFQAALLLYQYLGAAPSHHWAGIGADGRQV